MDNLAAFPHGVGDGFFHVNMFASLATPDGSERVPMVGGGDGNRVDLSGFKQFSKVAVSRGIGALGTELCKARGEHGGIHIAERSNPDTREFEVVVDVILAASIKPDDTDPQIAIGARGSGVDPGRKR
jgi:hypothetical protein